MSAAVTGSGGDVVLVFLFLARVDPLLFLLLDDVVVDFLFSAMVFDVGWNCGNGNKLDGTVVWTTLHSMVVGSWCGGGGGRRRDGVVCFVVALFETLAMCPVSSAN